MSDDPMYDVRRCPGCLGERNQATGRFFVGAQLCRCPDCRTEFLSPQPTDRRLAEIYGPDYYEPWAISDDPSVSDLKRRTFAPILEAAGTQPGDTLLDVGCATGVLVGEAAAAGLCPYGIDLNDHAIGQARSAVPEGTFACGMLADDSFPGVAFDAVTMVDFIEHVRDPEDELRRVRDHVRPGGRLVISTPRVDSLLRWTMQSSWPQYREEHLTYFSRQGIEATLERAGYTVESVQTTAKTLNLSYMYRQAEAFPTRLTPLMRIAHTVAPFARSLPVKVRLGEMTVVATSAL